MLFYLTTRSRNYIYSYMVLALIPVERNSCNFMDYSYQLAASDLLYARSRQCSKTGVTKTGMCYPVYGVVHIKEPLLLIGKSSPCGSSRFPLTI